MKSQNGLLSKLGIYGAEVEEGEASVDLGIVESELQIFFGMFEFAEFSVGTSEVVVDQHQLFLMLNIDLAKKQFFTVEENGNG